MIGDLDFLEKFPKDRNGLYIVYELYTFDNLFRLLLKNSFDHEEALCFILGNCSLSALVFQERIHNKGYKKLSAKDALPADLAACKAQLIFYLMWRK
ncbi:MAG: hypothetical protein QMD80_01840 [archaeon]|nr:hypothetical protein [archaeon]